MALDKLTIIDGGGLSTTSDYRVGVITATKFVGPFEGSITSTDATFTGSVSIGGTLTYEDVTNIDSVGLITARNGIDCNGDLDVDGHTNLDHVSISGITTVNGGTLTVSGNFPRFYFIDTAGSDLDAYIVNNSNLLAFGKTNSPTPSNDVLTLNLSSYLSTFKGNVAITKDLDVDGHTNLDNVSVSGISTFGGSTQNTMSVSHNSGYGIRVNRGSKTLDLNADWASSNNAAINVGASGLRFYYGSSSDGIQFNTGSGVDKVHIAGSGNVSILKDLDVDGHTNLDNVSIAGVTTTTGDLTISSNNLTIRDNGDVNLNLVADLDNSGESHVPTINFTQDGGVNVFKVGVEGDAGDTFTGSTGNTPYLITTTGHGGMNLDFGTNNALRMKLTNSALQPAASNTYDLGTNSLRWRDIYVDNFKTTSTGFETVGTQFKFSDAGDTNLIINADTDNNNEAHHPSLSFKQDGAVHVLDIGVNGSSPDYTGGTHNSAYLRTGGHVNAGFEIATGNGTPVKRLTIDHNGHIIPGADSTYNIGSNSVRFANVYADTLYGDGSNLSGISGVTINSNADNRIITGSGSANTLNGESNLTYDGTSLSNSAGGINLQSTGGNLINVTSTAANSRSTIKFNTNGNDWEIGARGSSGNPNNAFYFYDNAANAYRMIIDSSGNITKPNNPAFRARASSGGWKSFGNTSFNIMPFNTTDCNNGNHYNTSTYKFTVPVSGNYYFYCQMQHDGNTGNGGNSGRMQIVVQGVAVIAYGKSGRQGEVVSCGTVWPCVAGNIVYCEGATNTTNPDDWHGDSYYSFFTGYLVG